MITLITEMRSVSFVELQVKLQSTGDIHVEACLYFVST